MLFRSYLDALLTMHRGIDRTDGHCVLADDLGAFIERHPTYAGAREGLAIFFAASRRAFFENSAPRSRAIMPFRALDRLAVTLAAAERTQ